MKHQTFEAYYNDLIEYAKTISFKKGLREPPEELVNDAFISFIDSGREFDYTEVKKYIFGFAMKQLVAAKSNIEFSDICNNRTASVNQLYCVYCCDLKPENAFRIINNKGYRYPAKACSECENKRTVQWHQNNRERWNEYVRKRRWVKTGRTEPRQAQDIHILWKKANHKYIEKQRELLSDVYIRSLLKKDKRTPENIERKRSELLERRKKAA